jgi:microcystin-dependent protein
MEAYMTMITPYGLGFTVRSWARCGGQLLSIAQFSALYSLMGTLYGGDGITTFGLPNLQSRSPLNRGQGAGLDFIAQGQAGGREYLTLNVLNMPAHDHQFDGLGQLASGTGDLAVSTDAADTGDPDGNYLGQAGAPITPYTPNLSDPAGAQADVAEIPARSVQFNGSTQMTGGNQSFNSRSPYLGVNYQICIQGIFPSRN